MKLLPKLSIIFSLIFVLLFGALLTFVFIKVSDNITKIENTTTMMEIERVEDILKNEISFHSRKQADWSNWDDTHSFVTDLNPEYIKSNLTIESLKSLETQLILFYDVSGVLRHGIKLDDTFETVTQVETTATELLYLVKQLLEKNDPAYFIAGLTKIDGTLWIVSVRPILTSDASGPINGVLVFGSKWLEKNTKTLSGLSKRAVSISLHDETAWQKISKDGLQIKSPESVVPKTLIRDSDKVISGYSLLNDVDDATVAIMRVQSQRLFNDKIIPLTKDIGLTILVLGMICLACIVIVVRILIVQKIDGITDFVDSVRFGGITTARLASHGNDEISVLAQTIDRMLNSLFKIKD